MTPHETINSNASGSGKDDQKYSDARSTLLLPFSIHSSSVPPAGGYQALYSDQFKIDFNKEIEMAEIYYKTESEEE